MRDFKNNFRNNQKNFKLKESQTFTTPKVTSDKFKDERKKKKGDFSAKYRKGSNFFEKKQKPRIVTIQDYRKYRNPIKKWWEKIINTGKYKLTTPTITSQLSKPKSKQYVLLLKQNKIN